MTDRLLQIQRQRSQSLDEYWTAKTVSAISAFGHKLEALASRASSEHDVRHVIAMLENSGIEYVMLRVPSLLHLGVFDLDLCVVRSTTNPRPVIFGDKTRFLLSLLDFSTLKSYTYIRM